MGSHRLHQGAHFSISGIGPHPSYNPRLFQQDLALIKLSTKLTSKRGLKVGRVCLPRPGVDVPRKNACKVIGWGKTVRGRPDHPSQTSSPVLLETELAMVHPPTEVCYKTLSFFNEAVTICAYNGERSSSCNGDSGKRL